MKNKPEKKSKHPIGPYSFCPKHTVFYASCKCPLPGTRKAKENENDGTFVEE
jgi:hypothetical protein